MTPEAWITTAVILAILIAMVLNVASPAVIVFSGVVGLLIVGVLEPDEALSGFSNPAPFTVGAFLIVAAAISKTGAIRPLTRKIMGSTGNVRRPMLRMLAPTTFMSGFMNNIPLVAMMIPEIGAWAKKRGSTPSLFLLPLSFGAILGGMLTIIGTSTNLVIAGEMEEVGLEPFSFFEIGAIGLPIALVGIALIIVLSPRALRSRRSSITAVEDVSRDFSVEMEVLPNGAIEGLTVDGAGLRNLEGVFLVSITKGEEYVAPAGPDTVLHGGDILHFVGNVDQALDLRNVNGLVNSEHERVTVQQGVGPRYYTVAIGGDSPLVGRTLKEIGFRSRYQAGVVAIHRAGERLNIKLGEVPLRVGDAMIVISDAGFRDRWSGRSDFLLIANFGGEQTPAASGGTATISILGAVVLLAATGLMPILHASLAAVVALLVLRVLTPEEARRALDLGVLGVIAAAFGLAAAVSKTGLGDVVASGLADLFGFIGPSGVILGMALTGVALSSVISNNAAALMLMPIAIGAAEAAEVDPRGMAVVVAIAASASFLTPIGYQTNTMVYGPGGYHISDYVRVGWPLTAVALIGVVLLVPVFYGI